MNRHESTYHFKNTGAGTEAELARLRSQVHMSWEKEFRLLRWFGLKDGMHILEAGCGPGFYTEQLLDHWPGSKVTALDIDGFLRREPPYGEGTAASFKGSGIYSCRSGGGCTA